MQRFELGEARERAFFLGALVDACFDKHIRHFAMGTRGSIREAARMHRNRTTERFCRGT